MANLRQQFLDYRSHADAEAKMNERWRDAEAKLVADLAAAKSKEKLKAVQTEMANLRQQFLDYRSHADAEAKMNERWRDAEAKLVADLAAAYSPLFSPDFAKNGLLVTLLCVTIFL